MTKKDLKRQSEFRRQAEEATRNLRIGSQPLMRRLRELLIDKGFDPGSTVLVGIRVDDLYAHAGGSLVLPNGDAVGFGLEWNGSTAEQATLRQWAVDNDSPSRAIGLELLDQSQG